MTIPPVTWYRTGGQTVPPYNESLSITDGTVHMWRASDVPAAGYFTRPAPDGFAVEEPTQDLTVDPPPGGETEGLTVGERQATYGPGAELPEPWAGLHTTLLDLAEATFAFPEAALGLEVSDGAARLVHLGTDPVEVDLAASVVRVTLWSGWYASSERWASEPIGGGPLTAGTGWTYDLPFAHGLSVGPDRTLHVALDLSLKVRGNPLAAGLRHSPVPPPPPE